MKKLGKQIDGLLSSRCWAALKGSNGAGREMMGMKMRFAFLMLVLAGVLISGCASHPVDCAMGVGHNGCAPGTKEYEEMEQKQLDAKTSAEIDDARCQSYGRRGTPEYAECRRRAGADQQLIQR